MPVLPITVKNRRCSVKNILGSKHVMWTKLYKCQSVMAVLVDNSVKIRSKEVNRNRTDLDVELHTQKNL